MNDRDSQLDLDEVVRQILDATEDGRIPDLKEHVQRYPQFAEELRELFADISEDRDCDETVAVQGDRLPPAPGSTHGDPPPTGTGPAPAQQLGDYELIEEIARGGMGIVFKARQRSLNRIVAVKVILSGSLASEEEVARFQTEAASAARLRHPGIVAVYEVGKQDGQHFFSMELIEATPLSEYARQQELSWKGAASIVAKVADAVHYAHEQGVIHRDLKPSNILVDSNGDPHVTDFGLAKQIAADSSLTRTGQILGTPSYMPPEQAGSDVQLSGPQSDVYSLGAVLYESLTLRPPFRAENPVATVVQVINSPPVSPKILNPSVSRDLETICLRCLEKSPARRYATAKEVGEELRRVCDGQPIVARPVSSIERLWRFCVRSPAVASLSCGMVVAIILGVAGITNQWLRAERNAAQAVENAVRANQLANQESVLRGAAERAFEDAAEQAQRAREEADAARRVAQFMIGLFEGSDPIGLGGQTIGRRPGVNEEPTALELLDQGSRQLESQLQTSPRIRAALTDAVGRVYLSLGAIQKAEPLLETSLQLRRELRSGTHDDVGIARSLAAFGMVRYLQGRYDEAVVLLREGTETARMSSGTKTADRMVVKFCLAVVLLEGNLTGSEGAEAEEMLGNLVVELREAGDAAPRDMALTLLAYASALRAHGKTFEAVAAIGEAGLVIANCSDCGEMMDALQLVIMTLVQWKSGDVENAMRDTYRSFETVESLVGRNHPAFNIVQTQMANLMHRAGKLEEGAKLLEQCRDDALKIYGRQPRTARTMYWLASVQYDLNNLPEAERNARDALEINTAILGPDHLRTQRIQQMLGRIQETRSLEQAD